jgi:uncharacterized membrane-anchored protein YjiN (DUF445 family)
MLTENKRHHALLDHALEAIRKFLERTETRGYVAGEISKQWPMARWVAESLRLDDMAAANFLNFVIAKLDKIRSDPAHELRAKFDIFLRRFIERVKTDPALQAGIERLKNDALQSPAVAEYLTGLWAELRDWIEQDLQREESTIGSELAKLLERLGARMQAEPEVVDWLNDQILRTIPLIVVEHRDAVGEFIARQVNAWPEEKLVQELERNIGVDLQHIRINGTLVGGAAGLLIFTLTRLLANGQVHP